MWGGGASERLRKDQDSVHTYDCRTLLHCQGSQLPQTLWTLASLGLLPVHLKAQTFPTLHLCFPVWQCGIAGPPESTFCLSQGSIDDKWNQEVLNTWHIILACEFATRCHAAVFGNASCKLCHMQRLVAQPEPPLSCHGVVTSASLVVTGALLVVTMFATRNKCHASSNKKLLELSIRTSWDGHPSFL